MIVCLLILHKYNPYFTLHYLTLMGMVKFQRAQLVTMER